VVYFGLLTPQGEAWDTDGFTEMTKDRLDDTQAVDMAVSLAVNLLLHPLQRTGFVAGDMLLQHVDLTGSFLLDAAQALGAQQACVAAFLINRG